MGAKRGRILAVAKKKVGRPTDYDPKYCDELIEYFDVEPYREVEVTITYKDGRTETRDEERPNDLPTLAGFARKIGVHRDTLHEWANAVDNEGNLKHPDFSDAIKKAKEFQEDIWDTNGMKGHYVAPFAIFFGKNNLGYKDKREIEVATPAGYGDLEKQPRADSPDDAKNRAKNEVR